MTNLARAHANYSPDWWTPLPWMWWVADTLGEGWFDPCPRERPASFDDGLAIPWPGSVYCNHPGGRGNATMWWSHFLDNMVRHGDAAEYIWCGFNLEQLRTLKPSPLQLDGWLVVPKKRIAYIDGRTGEPAKSPSQATFFWLNVEPADPPEPCIITRTG